MCLAAAPLPSDSAPPPKKHWPFACPSRAVVSFMEGVSVALSREDSSVYGFFVAVAVVF